MPDLLVVTIPNDAPPPRPMGRPPEVDVIAVRFVLDSVIDFLEDLTLSGESLRHAGQLLRDVEALRKSL